jgi:hypothetical protein
MTHGNVSGWTGWINVTWNTTNVCNGNKINLTLINMSSNAGHPLNTSLSYAQTSAWSAYQNGTLTLNQTLASATGKRVNVIWQDGSINKIEYPEDNGFGDTLKTAGESEYTPTWGTWVSRDSSSQVSMMYPEAMRIGKLAVGRVAKTNYTLNSDEYNSVLDVTLVSAGGDSVAMNNIAIGLAKLDTEITSSSLDKPIVLLGGPNVNQLTNELAAAGSTKTASEFEMDRAYVDLVEDAFNSMTALVIAGYAGPDTRKAAQVVASQVLGQDMGLTGTSVTLNTAGATYSDVTVV